jgi:ribosomal protein S18 acetylase RimI-like enzyme
MRERDLYPLFSWQGMRLGLLSEAAPPPAELEIRRVERPEDHSIFARIKAQAYKSAESPYVELIAGASTWSKEFTGYLAFLNGEAVSTVGALPAEGVFQICWVATLVSQRRKGFADALLRYALADQWEKKFRRAFGPFRDS